MSSSSSDYFKFKAGVLTADGVRLDEIAKSVGTPVYVYSADAFLRPLRALQSGLKDIDHLVCFAVKANSNLSVLNLLGAAGAGMDLVSGGELFRARKAGIPSDRIVFSGVGKSATEIRDALRIGIYSFNVESVAELELLNQLALEEGRRAPIALRFNPNVDAKTHPYISTGLRKNKFGMDRKEVLSVVKSLSRMPGISLVGISIHIGSQLLSLSPLRDAFGRVRDLLDALKSILPEPLQFVDLGGGLGITYRAERPPAIADYCKLILKYFGPRAGLDYPLRVLLEPGRTLSGNAGVLLTEVLYRKPRGKKDFLVVDAAMNDLLRPALYGSFHDILPISQTKNKGKAIKTDVVGPVCETSDCLGSDRLLSSKLASGDLLAILSTGAYGYSMSSNYNSRPRPPEVLVRNGRFEVIRKRETYEELIRGETPCEPI